MKTAIITGASRGIGKAIACEFARNGYAIAMLSRNYQELDAAFQELVKLHGACGYAIKCDISDEEQVKSAFKNIYEKFGSIDVLVNNAGVNSRRTLSGDSKDNLLTKLKEDIAGFDEEIRINLRGTYLCSYVARSYMIAQKSGAIINISSIKGKEATTSPGYGASKAGVIKLTRDFAKSTAPFGIRVNCIAPGFIDTGMTAELSQDKQTAYKALIPQGRFGSCEEIARVVLFLASENSSYITGATLDVNGGYLMD